MQLAIDTRNVTHGPVLAAARATIKASPKVFNFFSDKIYANKKLAVVRELVANAVDAHVMAGNPAPITIVLPSAIDPVFKVKDQGVGMSHRFVMTDYMALGDGSTKDQSNDAVGGFGVGKAATFGYTDQYTLRVVHDGTISVYNVFLDVDGVPSINLLQQGSTTEANGVEVSFPVKDEDIGAFEEIVFENMKYFDPLPIVLNTRRKFEAPKYLSKGDNWGMRPTGGNLNVIIGGILYPVNIHSLPYELRNDETVGGLLSYGLDIRLPIGSVEIALSREALSYTSRTNEAIKAGLLSILDEIKASFATMFDQYETLWEAKVALGTELGLGGYGYSSRAKFLGKNALYHGQPFSAYLNEGLINSYWEVPASGDRGGNSLNPKWDAEGSITVAPKLIETVVIDDLEISPKSRTVSRLKAWLADQTREKRILVIRPIDHTDYADLIKRLGNPPVVLTSSMPIPAAQPRVKNVRPRVRMWTYDGRERQSNSFEYVNNLNPGSHAARSKGVTEILYNDQPATGILVVMENFNLPANLRNKIATGLLSWNELHFVNRGDADKLKLWKKWEDVFAERAKQALAQYPHLTERLAVANASETSNLFHYFRKTGLHKTLTSKQKSTPFGKLARLFETYVEPLTPEEKKLASLVTPTMPKGVDLAKLMTDFKNNQSDLFDMIGLVSSYSTTSTYNHLVLRFI